MGRKTGWHALTSGGDTTAGTPLPPFVYGKTRERNTIEPPPVSTVGAVWGVQKGTFFISCSPLRNGKERRLPTSRLKKERKKCTALWTKKSFFGRAADPEIDIHISTKAVWVKIEEGGGEWSVRWELPILFCSLPRSVSGTCRKFSTSGKEGAPPPPHPSSHLLYPISSAHLPNSHYCTVEKEGRRPIHFLSRSLFCRRRRRSVVRGERGRGFFLSLSLSLSLLSYRHFSNPRPLSFLPPPPRLRIGGPARAASSPELSRSP